VTIKLSEHVVDLKGRDYLPVAPRIAYFREHNPAHSIVTDVTVIDGEPRMVRATISDANGSILATAHKTVTAFAGGAVEKAETGAIGRALSLVGIGTMQALDMDEGDDIAESPAPRPAPTPAHKPTAAAARKADAARDVPPTADELADIAGLGLDELRAAYSAATNAGRVTLAAQIKGMADTLKTKAAA
jgi:hypothetical protein